MIKSYYWLAKPGIIYGNVMTAVGGFFMASRLDIDFFLLVTTIVGLSLIIGSACVYNNIYDRDIDARMSRTQRRAIVSGEISKRAAIVYGLILVVLGSLILSAYTNYLSLGLALLAWLIYVCVYTPLKTRTMHATLIGTIPGALPIVIGYTAVTDKFDLGGLLLFLVMVCWQMPHFYSIAIYRLQDYQAAGVPVLPIRQGIAAAKIHIMIYIMVFIILATLLNVFGYMGYIYIISMLAVGIYWLRLSIRGWSANIDSTLWAKKLFRFSLIVLTVLSIMISINPKNPL